MIGCYQLIPVEIVAEIDGDQRVIMILVYLLSSLDYLFGTGA